MRKQFLIGLAFAALSLPWVDSPLAAELVYVPQVSNERGVKITATLQSIPNDAKTCDFEVVMETHTQSLSDDLTKSSVLIADGKQYQPLNWEGAPPGGHHRKGILHFRAIAPQPASVELQIRLTGESAPRSFKWRLK